MAGKHDIVLTKLMTHDPVYNPQQNGTDAPGSFMVRWDSDFPAWEHLGKRGYVKTITSRIIEF